VFLKAALLASLFAIKHFSAAGCLKQQFWRISWPTTARSGTESNFTEQIFARGISAW
jgi:hypothetical protein